MFLKRAVAGEFANFNRETTRRSATRGEYNSSTTVFQDCVPVLYGVALPTCARSLRLRPARRAEVRSANSVSHHILLLVHGREDGKAQPLQKTTGFN